MKKNLIFAFVCCVFATSCINSSTTWAWRSNTNNNAYEAQRAITDSRTEGAQTVNAEKQYSDMLKADAAIDTTGEDIGKALKAAASPEAAAVEKAIETVDVTHD